MKDIFSIKHIYISCFFIFTPLHAEGLRIKPSCLAGSSLIFNMQQIGCSTNSLSIAIQKDNLLRKVSAINFFGEIHKRDIVRSKNYMSFFNRDLTNKISETIEKYNKKNNHYVLNITSYPSNIKTNTCSKNKTIDASETHEIITPGTSENSPFVYNNYKAIPGKSPLIFETRQYQNQLVLCANTLLSKEERIDKFCKTEKCKTFVTSSCIELDRKGAINVDKKTSKCFSFSTFSTLVRKLIMSNISISEKYCPNGCSYYTQTMYRMYKKSAGKNCFDNYLVVHCGPERKDGYYNLNVREIKDLCTDFQQQSSCKFTSI